MIVMKRAYFYWGLGLCTAVAMGAAGLLVWRSKTKVNLALFDSPDLPGSGQCMDAGFIKMLKQLERKTGYPIFDWIKSGARSTEWNRRVGGVTSSSHLIPTCKAADIEAANTTIRDVLVAAAREVGFKRIGIGNTFVHLDNDAAKKQYVAWGYPLGSAPPYNPFVT